MRKNKSGLIQYTIMLIGMILMLLILLQKTEDLSDRIISLESSNLELQRDAEILENRFILQELEHETDVAEIFQTMDWQTTNTNMRIDSLETAFNEVKLQRLFIDEAD